MSLLTGYVLPFLNVVGPWAVAIQILGVAISQAANLVAPKSMDNTLAYKLGQLLKAVGSFAAQFPGQFAAGPGGNTPAGGASGSPPVSLPQGPGNSNPGV